MKHIPITLNGDHSHVVGKIEIIDPELAMRLIEGDRFEISSLVVVRGVTKLLIGINIHRPITMQED